MTAEFNKPKPTTPASNASQDPPKASAAAPAAAPSLVTRVETELDADKRLALAEIRLLAHELHDKIHAIEAVGSREISLAKTKIEEAVHWVGAHFHKSATAAAPPAK